MNMTISALQQHFHDMYGLRNSFVNGSIHERMLHFIRRVGRIADARRKGDRMEGRLARAVSYFMSCVDNYGFHLDLELGMIEKFPHTGCVYCNKLPCKCTEARPDPEVYTLHEEQRSWTIRQWQAHLKSVYGHFHGEDFNKVFLRFVSEVGEFAILNANGPNTPIGPEDLLIECRREAADVFSWILTMAYVMDIDLQEAIRERYEVCPGCKKNVNCSCDLVFISKDRNFFSTVGTPDFTKTNPDSEK